MLLENLSILFCYMCLCVEYSKKKMQSQLLLCAHTWTISKAQKSVQYIVLFGCVFTVVEDNVHVFYIQFVVLWDLQEH